MSREILVVTSTKHPSTAAKVSGVYRYAKTSQWKVRVVDMPADPEDVPPLLELWAPDGCIFEAGAATKLPDSAAFARAGYDSVIAFDRFFKSRTGKTPSKWQESSPGRPRQSPAESLRSSREGKRME